MLQDEELIEINMTYAWDSVVLLEGLLKSIYEKSSDLFLYNRVFSSRNDEKVLTILSVKW